jgi:hypothetical protein
MSVKETEMQKIWQHHFLQPVEWEGGCKAHVPTELVRIATLNEFDVKIVSSKRTQSTVLKKNAGIKNKARQNALGLANFSSKYYLRTF